MLGLGTVNVSVPFTVGKSVFYAQHRCTVLSIHTGENSLVTVCKRGIKQNALHNATFKPNLGRTE